VSKRHTERIGDLESMFLRLEELVLANSGADEFEEVFQLVIAKLWDERCGRPARFRRGRTPAATARAIAELLAEARSAWPDVLPPGARPGLTDAHLDVCTGVIEPQRLSDAGLDAFDAFFEFLVARSAKGRKGQFFTPRHVVELCVRLVDPRAGEVVLDPACGSGAFLVHVLEHVRRRHTLSRTALERYAADSLHGVDLDARALRVARALLVVAGAPTAELEHANSLLAPRVAGLATRESVDVILTNPPFAGDVRERALLDAYDLGRGKPRAERDMLFVERCVELLRPGGRMAIVLPQNKLGSAAFAPLRAWLSARCRVRGVVGLGRTMFLPHTHQATGVLLVEKRASGEVVSGDESVLFAVSERPGKDGRGRPILRVGARSRAGAPLTAWERIDHDFDSIVESFAPAREDGERKAGTGWR
jgi:type I restriction enzyme M protein